MAAAGDTRGAFDKEILMVVRSMEGRPRGELEAEFTALDADGSGELELGEGATLVGKVLGQEVSPEAVAAVFDEMDTDNSKGIDFDEFARFFGVE